MGGPDSGAERAFEAALDGVLADLALPVDDSARARMLGHYRLLVQWNRRMNLTTLRDPREVAVRHFGESLFLVRELAIAAETVLDVGSGAGFPGLPLAACSRNVKVTLLEGVQRKAVFLREASRSWGNVEVRNERLEAFAGRWDLTVMRAVSIEAALPCLARISGRTALLIGLDGAEEARSAGFFDWAPAVSLPWGERKVLLQGRALASA